MEQSPRYSPLQKAFTLLMAVLVLGMALLLPFSSNAHQKGLQEQEVVVSGELFQHIPYFASIPESLPKLNVFNWALTRLWSLFLILSAPEVQEHQAHFRWFFIQKINFIFVSTQAP